MLFMVLIWRQTGCTCGLSLERNNKIDPCLAALLVGFTKWWTSTNFIPFGFAPAQHTCDLVKRTDITSILPYLCIVDGTPTDCVRRKQPWKCTIFLYYAWNTSGGGAHTCTSPPIGPPPPTPHPQWTCLWTLLHNACIPWEVSWLDGCWYVFVLTAQL